MGLSFSKVQRREFSTFIESPQLYSRRTSTYEWSRSMITINSNSSALMAQNNLYTNQANLQGNMQQLSTGLRINSASDDAAGMQIANRMETQMNGLGVAQRNANDAISLAQTAEGAMSENNTILNRMRDLSLQSANDTNTDDDRAAMQKEVDALIEEVDRIADTTNFAGIKLLDGSAENMSFQIGSNAEETIEFGIGDMSASALNGTVYNVDTSSLMDFDDSPEGDGTLTAGVSLTFSDSENGNADVKVELTEDMSRSDVVDAFNQIDGVNAVLDESNKVVLTGSGLSRYDDLAAEGGLNVDISGNEESVKDIDITTAVGAQNAIEVLDGALKQVDEERADLGAVQNRLDSTISNLSNIEENLGVAQSGIQDADFAKQTVEMTSNQMLMQAGTSVLAQAKTMPQYATMLL